MNTQERQIIDDLFDKLREAERQSNPREPEADNHIRSRVAAQPGAPYCMAQTIVMQEQALQSAQARLAELEDELSRRASGGGGFLSGLFGGGQPSAPPIQPRPDNMQGSPLGAAAGSSRWAAPAPGMTGAHPAGRGGFLAGAGQAAISVAGGMMLGALLGSAFGGGQANAAEAEKPQPEPQPAAAEDSGDFDGGFDEDI